MNDDQAPKTLLQAVRHSALGLALFAVLTAGIIAVTQALTADRIKQNQDEFAARTLFELVPESTHDNDLLNSHFSTDLATLNRQELLGLKEAADWYQAKQEGEVTAVLLPLVAPEGYTEAIRLLIAVDRTGTLLGVRVLQHKETPGLGDGIELTKSDWIRSFDDQSLMKTPLEQWQVKKDGGRFDQLTGATITPRAIVQAVARGLVFFNANRSTLLSENPSLVTP